MYHDDFEPTQPTPRKRTLKDSAVDALFAIALGGVFALVLVFGLAA
jgi:hypothetical protein